ncbi:MAG: HAMP domain-containing histidine kinase [Alteromonadales bacterium]|nr:HAMP domain-containing histidine kinase [Alteromonadales bacterium]
MRVRPPVKENHLPRILSIYPSSLFSLAFCICSLLLTYLTYQSLKQSQHADKQRYQAYLLATQLHQYSDQLSLMVRSYAVTGNKKYLNSYHEIISIRSAKQSSPQFYHRVYWDMSMPENGIAPFATGEKKSFKQLMKELKLPKAESELLLQAKNAIKQLALLELQAISEVGDGLESDSKYERSSARENALALLYSDSYLLQKANIKQYINTFFDLQEPRSKEKGELKFYQHYILATLTIISFLLLILFLLYNLRVQSKNKVLFVKALRREVSSRTLELFEKREQLKVVINEMEETKDQLVESEKMASLGNLVGGVAHEVNTPLGIGVTLGSHIQEETKELLSKVESGKLKRSDLDLYCHELVDSCALLLSNLDRAANLISSFKQVAVDQSCEEIRAFKLSEYIDEVLLSLHPRIKKTAIKVEVIAPQDEPFLNTYPGAIAQIVTNLVINGLIHAFDNGKESGNICFLLTCNEKELIMKVEDDGKGMLPEVAKNIFEPFYTTLRGKGGSGLGMSIVYNLVVHQLQGSIKCHSIIGEGTTFNICFPIQIDSHK